ncbi:hypothetical protein SSCG_03676 [Streptomyces clavuligerus]|nr:hypothetical protein SSCG_03676 [Streptomyces clavuligerus]
MHLGPATGDVRDLGQSPLGTIGERSAAVAADQLHVRVLAKPGGEGVGCVVGEARQRGGAADRHGQLLGHPAPGLAGEFACQAFQQASQGDGTPAVAEGEPVDLFGEGPFRAGDVATREAADQRVDRRGLCPDVRAGESSYLSAVRPLRYRSGAGPGPAPRRPGCPVPRTRGHQPEGVQPPSREQRLRRRLLRVGQPSSTPTATLAPQQVSLVRDNYGLPPVTFCKGQVRFDGVRTRVLPDDRWIMPPPDRTKWGQTVFGATAESLVLSREPPPTRTPRRMAPRSASRPQPGKPTRTTPSATATTTCSPCSAPPDSNRQPRSRQSPIGPLDGSPPPCMSSMGLQPWNDPGAPCGPGCGAGGRRGGAGRRPQHQHLTRTARPAPAPGSGRRSRHSWQSRVPGDVWLTVRSCCRFHRSTP